MSPEKHSWVQFCTRERKGVAHKERAWDCLNLQEEKMKVEFSKGRNWSGVENKKEQMGGWRDKRARWQPLGAGKLFETIKAKLLSVFVSNSGSLKPPAISQVVGWPTALSLKSWIIWTAFWWRWHLHLCLPRSLEFQLNGFSLCPKNEKAAFEAGMENQCSINLNCSSALPQFSRAAHPALLLGLRAVSCFQTLISRLKLRRVERFAPRHLASWITMIK